MTKYEIELLESYVCFQQSIIMVEAETEEEAREIARKCYDEGMDTEGNYLDWDAYDTGSYEFDGINILDRIKKQYTHRPIERIPR